MTEQLTATEFDALKAEIKSAFPDAVSYTEMVECVTKGMMLVGPIKKLSGEQKKKIVIELLIYAMEETDSGAMEKYEHYIIDVIPSIIDFLIETEKGKLRFNTKIKHCLFSCRSKSTI